MHQLPRKPDPPVTKTFAIEHPFPSAWLPQVGVVHLQDRLKVKRIMKIGELARRAGVTTSRIRFYEESGLLPPAARSPNGYREYAPRDLKIIAFIERAQKLGFSLREIGVFLDRPPTKRSAQELLPALRAKLVEIDTHLREVKARRREIVRLIEEIGGG